MSIENTLLKKVVERMEKGCKYNLIGITSSNDRPKIIVYEDGLYGTPVQSILNVKKLYKDEHGYLCIEGIPLERECTFGEDPYELYKEVEENPSKFPTSPVDVEVTKWLFWKKYKYTFYGYWYHYFTDTTIYRTYRFDKFDVESRARYKNRDLNISNEDPYEDFTEEVFLLESDLLSKEIEEAVNGKQTLDDRIKSIESPNITVEIGP